MIVLRHVPVTEANLGEVRSLIGTKDQAREALVGSEVSLFRFTYDKGSVGTLTVYHDLGRAAISYGSASDWGDWDEDLRTITTDDGCVCNTEGETLEVR